MMSLDCTAQHEPKQSKEEPAKRSERRTLRSHQFKAKAKFQASWASAFDFFSSLFQPLSILDRNRKRGMDKRGS